MNSLLSSFCIFLIKVYRVFFSAHFGGACRFSPSCSCYAEQVFWSHSPKKAIKLTLKRLMKCRFFGPYGLDLAPSIFLSNNLNISSTKIKKGIE